VTDNQAEPDGRGRRLVGKVAVVIGAGQTPGDTLGNGRATALLMAREGAFVISVDRDEARALDTSAQIEGEGFETLAIAADVTDSSDCERIVSDAIAAAGHVDVLHNNVGIGTGDAGATNLTEDAWHLIHDVNLKSMWLTTREVLPHMRERQTGVITNVGSAAAVCSTPFLAYKTSKAAVNAMTQQLAVSNARFGIRVNAIMPGLIDTPMAIEGISAATGVDPGELREQRNRLVPLGHKMGTAWDVAQAAVFLASGDAAFITGAILPVDGGQSARVG
jgi:NAD(P)-dependent dehydrogenase (short-subunit alcohol dehydrogenase family)